MEHVLDAPTKLRRLRPMLIFWLAISALSGCATINPVRVPPGHEDDSKFTSGLHFYEMRPFVLVQKPFPIWSKSVLVNGQVSADGSMVRLPCLTEKYNKFVESILDQQCTTATQFSTQSLATTVKGVQPPQAQSDATTVPPPASPAVAANTPGTGSIAYSVNKDGTPFVPVNDLFSFIFLPDYRREYTVDMSTWFGFKKVEITVAPGGGLLSYNGTVDNSAIVGPLIDTYKNLVAAGGAVAAAAINPHAAAVGQASKVVSGQSADTIVGAQNQLVAGSTVTLRLTKIRYAVPGAYPIQKPGEPQYYFDSDGTEKKVEDKDRRGYTVHYDYYDVPVVEALIDPPKSIIVSSALPPGGDNSPANSACTAKKTIPSNKVGSAALAKFLNQSDGTLKLTFVAPPAVKKDGDGCINEVDLTAQSGDAKTPFKDDDGNINTLFKQTYPGTKLVFQ
jgi:hypothetical protein